KTEHHDVERVVFLGPQAQEVLGPLLEGRRPEHYLLSPREAMEAVWTEKRAPRKTRGQPSQVCKKRRRPKKALGRRDTGQTYGRAIAKACQRAQVPHWSPNQLRHTRATEVRREEGLDAAQAVLGHTYADVSQVYAELNWQKAAEVMEKTG